MAKRTKRRNDRYSHKRNSRGKRVSKRRRRVSRRRVSRRRVSKKTYKHKNMRGGSFSPTIRYPLQTLLDVYQVRNITKIPPIEGYTIEAELINDSGGSDGQHRNIFMCNHVKLAGGERIGFTNVYLESDSDETKRPHTGHIVYSYLKENPPIGYLGSPDTQLSSEEIIRYRVFYELVLSTFGLGGDERFNLDDLLSFCDKILDDNTINLSGILTDCIISMESPRIKIYAPANYLEADKGELTRIISEMEKNEFDELIKKLPSDTVLAIRKMCDEYLEYFRDALSVVDLDISFP